MRIRFYVGIEPMRMGAVYVHAPYERVPESSSIDEVSSVALSKSALMSAGSQLPVERYDHRKGLKSLQVHQTLISKEGRIWSATPSGLACYDGVNTFMFDRKHGLSSHGLRTIAVHPDNTLWLGTDIGIEVLDISGMIPSVLWSKQIGTVNCLEIDEAYGVIGTSNGVFFWRGGDKIERSADKELAHATITSSLLPDRDSVWLVGPMIGIVNLKSEVRNENRFADVEAAISTPRILAQGPDGQILVGGILGLALIGSDGVCIAHFQTDSRVSSLLDYDSYIWVGAGNLLFRLNVKNKTLALFDVVRDDVSVLHLMSDSFENLWISTGDQALLRISGMRKTFAESFDADIGSIMCIRRQKQGLFIGGSNGLVKGNQGTAFSGLMVWDVLVDEFGKIWAATEGGLYCTVNPHFSIPYRHTDCDVVAAPCRALAFYQNNLYICSTRGLAVVTVDGVSEVLDPTGKSLGYVYSLHVDARGRLWIATLGRGVYRIEEGSITAVKIDTMADHSNVYAFAYDDKGHVYVAHDNLISKINAADQAEVLVDANVAISAWALKCLDDERLVAGTSNGLIVYNINDGSVRRRISGNFDGVPWEFTTSRSLEILDGRTVYCGLGSGLRKVNLDELAKMEQSPSAAFTDARWRGVNPGERNGVVTVAAGLWHLEVGLKTCWYLDDCSMRWRLNGFSEAWSPWSEVGPVSLTSLPVGDYLLEVEIRSPLAGSGSVKPIYSFSVV